MIKQLKILFFSAILATSQIASAYVQTESTGYLDQQLSQENKFSSPLRLGMNKKGAVIAKQEELKQIEQKPITNYTPPAAPSAPPSIAPAVQTVAQPLEQPTAIQKKDDTNLKNLQENRNKQAKLVNSLIKNNYNIYNPPKELYDTFINTENSHLPPVYFKSYYLYLAFKAAKENNLNDLRAVLVQFDFLNGQDENGNTLLMAAVQSNSIDTARLLLAKGAYVNAVNNYQKTALHYAATMGGLNSTKLLLSFGADYTLKDNQDMTALDYATANQRSEIVAMINQYMQQNNFP